VKQMQNAFSMSVLSRREKLGKACAKLEALSPLHVMARGYAIPSDGEGNVIRSAKALKNGDEFDLKFHDGQKHCLVMEKQV
jgi:exodeoxyribonuclease VII large subunit